MLIGTVVIPRSASVLPLTREWIEMEEDMVFARAAKVLPLTREWIEI